VGEVVTDIQTEQPERPPTRPGEVLREDVLPALGVSVSQLCGIWA